MTTRILITAGVVLIVLLGVWVWTQDQTILRLREERAHAAALAGQAKEAAEKAQKDYEDESVRLAVLRGEQETIRNEAHARIARLRADNERLAREKERVVSLAAEKELELARLETDEEITGAIASGLEALVPTAEPVFTLGLAPDRNTARDIARGLARGLQFRELLGLCEQQRENCEDRVVAQDVVIGTLEQDVDGYKIEIGLAREAIEKWRASDAAKQAQIEKSDELIRALSTQQKLFGIFRVSKGLGCSAGMGIDGKPGAVCGATLALEF